MTTRELMMHLLLNGDLDAPVSVEVKVPQNKDGGYLTFDPLSVSRIGGDCIPVETLIECKPYKEDV